MRTLAILTALILSLIASTVFASEDVKKAGKAKPKIELPPMNFGSPEEVDTDELRKLKSKLVTMPEMNWGSPEEIDTKALEMLRICEQISLPPMNWGSPEEVIVK